MSASAFSCAWFCAMSSANADGELAEDEKQFLFDHTMHILVDESLLGLPRDKALIKVRENKAAALKAAAEKK